MLGDDQAWRLPDRDENSQQPMSLMTINANPSKKEGDLLTIRILESSERKMQLIKELLSTEEYNSLAKELSPEGLMHNKQSKWVELDDNLATRTSRSMPTNIERAERTISVDIRSCDSAGELGLPTVTSADLHENLAKKREAVEFFFREAPDEGYKTNQPSSNLAIELRSGYYLSTDCGTARTDSKQALLKEYEFSLMDRLVGLLGFLGIPTGCLQLSSDQPPDSEDGAEAEFERSHKTLNREPYTRKRNLTAMRTRLKSDGHLERLVSIKESDDRLISLKFSNLVDLARMHTNQLATSHELLQSRIPRQQIRLIESVGHFNTIHLMPATEHIDLDVDEDLLQYHPRVGLIMKYLKRRKEIPPMRTSESKMNGSRWVQLTLTSCRITEHPLMLADERFFNLQIENELSPSDNKCSHEELTRRRQIRQFVNSLQIHLLIGDNYCHCSTARLQENRLFTLDLNTKLQIPVASQPQSKKIPMRVEILERIRLLPFVNKPVVVGTSDDILASMSQKIVLRSHDAEIGAQFDFSLVYFEKERRGNQRHISDHLRKLVDHLHSQVFIARHPFDDTPRKLSRLLNRIDPYLLLELLERKLPPPEFVLDPFVDIFDQKEVILAEIDDDIGLATGPVHASRVGHERWASTRQALIVWRWLNETGQLVYLSERENIKYYGLQMEEELGRRLAATFSPVHQQESGYRAIEQARLWAAEYLKQYETQLREVLRFNAEKNVRPVSRLRELLLEPKLKLNLTGARRLAKRLVPQRTARRPLLPKRQNKAANGLVSGDSSIHSISMLALHQPDSVVADLEHGAPSQVNSMQAPGAPNSAAADIASHWHQVATLRSRLQLVVTIQQAINVPMRVVQVPTMTAGRPTSPFSPPASPAPSFVPSSVQRSVQHQQILQAPICYIELVFQRRQQASSLAQGKHPAWNETLFFPVELSGGRLTQSNTSTQLVDEFLQLNLYDYNCYLVQHDPKQDQMSDMSTMPLVSSMIPAYDELGRSLASTVDQSLTGPVVRTSRQHIERHLLGSLRIPLSALMSNGRIEGSFALSQPLFLDNHQFEPVGMTVNRAASPTDVIHDATRVSLTKTYETLISLFITLDPPVSIPLHLYLPTGTLHEHEHVFQYARLWEQVVSRQQYNHSSAMKHSNLLAASSGTLRRPRPMHQNRHVRALVLQREARYCLVCRLLGPLVPPLDLLEQCKDVNGQMKILARYVSLMSPLKYGSLGMRLLASSLWFDSCQLVNSNLGGPEEKAVLLCNYFLYLGKCSALLLGDSVPEGRCVWVLVWQDKTSFIEDQLQLQAANLLESIGNLAPGGNRGASTMDASGQRPPVDQTNFLARLPILINANSVQLWDPCSAKSYSLAEPLPLISVGSIVTVDNVFANIQSVEQPARSNYDIRLRQCWCPLFEPGATSSLNSQQQAALSRSLKSSLKVGLAGAKQVNWRRQLYQLETLRKSIARPPIVPLVSIRTELDYQRLSNEHCSELRDMIERSVKSHLIKWRPDRPTYFNRTLARILAERLALFEGHMTATTDTKNPNDDTAAHNEGRWRFELAELIRDEVLMAHLSANGFETRQVISCPVNLPYTTMKTILDSVFASGVHNADLVVGNADQRSISSTQFLVACHAHPYPARVVSVWLYAAAIVPNARHNQTTNRLLLSP